MRATRTILAILAATILAGAAHAASDFPPLTGDVVDNAHVLSPSTQKTLTAELADVRHKTGHRLVVATVASLGGRDIESYGIDLFRTWKVGRAGTNDGAILLIAPHEHRDRIEVGYGLEGTLTDAQTHLILEKTVRPYLKSGNYDMAALAGERAVTQVLAPPPGTAPPPPPEPDVPWWAWAILLFFFGLLCGFAALIVWVVRAAIRSASGARAQARAAASAGAAGWQAGQAARSAAGDTASSARAMAEAAAAMAAAAASMAPPRPAAPFGDMAEAMRQRAEAMRNRPGTKYMQYKSSDDGEAATASAETTGPEASAEPAATETASTFWDQPAPPEPPIPWVDSTPVVETPAAPADDSRNYSGGTAGGGGASDSW